MLERIPATKAVLDNRLHAESRNIVLAAVKAQTPILSFIKKNPATLGCLKGIEPSVLKNAEEHPSGLFHLAILKILTSEGIGSWQLELPVSPGKGIIYFAREAGDGWDSFCASGDSRTEEYGEFGIMGSDANALFSRMGTSQFRLSDLLLNAKREVGNMETFQALSDFKAGKIGFDALKEFYARDRIELKGARAVDDGVEIETGGNRVLLPNIDSRLDSLRKFSEKLFGDIAKRLSVGFNPLL